MENLIKLPIAVSNPTHISLAGKRVRRARGEFHPEGMIFINCISKWWGLNAIPEIVQPDRGLGDDKGKRYNVLDERTFDKQSP